MKKVLVTGSSGLIGSEVSCYFAERGYAIHGMDNNQRAVFFGPQGDTRWNQRRLEKTFSNYEHHDVDIRHREQVLRVLEHVRPDFVVHTAAQPSHDLAAKMPFDDFDTNASGTLNIIEAVRRICPGSPVVHMSTNKVYGDAPNRIKLKESSTRWDYDDPAYSNGIPEHFPIDQSMHSLFGASKVAADVIVQEYGRYFGMATCCLRGGCLTGPNHSGVELHGFLSFLVKSNLESSTYKVYGYKGKQVRDNIHSLDVARFIHAFFENPKSGAVYNIGGGRENDCSILEAFELVAEVTGRKMIYEYVDQNRMGDHICYYSDLRRMRSDYPSWSVAIGLKQTIMEIVESWHKRG